MSNFDLKKFLTENKLTTASKHLLEERVEEGKTIDGSTIKVVKGPIGSDWVDLLKNQKDFPIPPPLPPDVNDAIKAYLNDPKSNYSDFGTGNDSTATKAYEAFTSYVLHNKKLSKADKGYYINQFNTAVMGKKKGKPAPPPLPAGAKKGRVRAAKGTPPPPLPPKR